jgi:choloylglycine hydrolase
MMPLILSICLLLIPYTNVTAYDGLESDSVKTIRSFKKLDEFPLYSMHFFGDYDLPDFRSTKSLGQDTQTWKPIIDSSSWACTCFSAKTEQGHQIFGRNFDWQDHPALLLFTDPPARYASVSMVDISYLGYTKNDDPTENPGALLRSPLLPFDGMNEQGLAVGMMALNTADGPHDPQKQTINSLMIIRLMLDHAKDLEEAIAIFKSFNIDFQGGPSLHYFITDRSGRSVVVELVDKKLSVLSNTKPWQVATNFVLTGLSLENSRGACWRYKKAWDTLENQGGMSSSASALSLLKDVSQPNTIWSLVYDTSALNFLVVMGKKYDQIHKFNLKQAVLN